jgi:hypothetical protein
MRDYADWAEDAQYEIKKNGIELDEDDRWNGEVLRIKLAEISERQARERAEETTTQKFYRFAIGSLLLTALVWWGLLL